MKDVSLLSRKTSIALSILAVSMLTACGTSAPPSVTEEEPYAEGSFENLNLFDQTMRWGEVQRAVDHAGVTHDGAFYGSRSYWHTGFLPGTVFAFEQFGSLEEKTVVDGKGAVHIVGDVNADLRITGQAIVFIRGSLNATLTLQGNCEVILADGIGVDGAIACDGTLHVWVGKNVSGLIGSTRGLTAIIQADLRGLVRCGEPASTITVHGDVSGKVIATPEVDALLTLRVDGYMPTPKVLEVMAGGFTRVNASIGESDAPPGLYPEISETNRPVTSRWVVHRQRVEP